MPGSNKVVRQISSVGEAREVLALALSGTDFELDENSQRWLMRALGNKFLENLQPDEFARVADVAMATLDKKNAGILMADFFNGVNSGTPYSVICRALESWPINDPEWEKAMAALREMDHEDVDAYREVIYSFGVEIEGIPHWSSIPWRLIKAQGTSKAGITEEECGILRAALPAAIDPFLRSFGPDTLVNVLGAIGDIDAGLYQTMVESKDLANVVSTWDMISAGPKILKDGAAANSPNMQASFGLSDSHFAETREQISQRFGIDKDTNNPVRAYVTAQEQIFAPLFIGMTHYPEFKGEIGQILDKAMTFYTGAKGWEKKAYEANVKGAFAQIVAQIPKEQWSQADTEWMYGTYIPTMAQETDVEVWSQMDKILPFNSVREDLKKGLLIRASSSLKPLLLEAMGLKSGEPTQPRADGPKR